MFKKDKPVHKLNLKKELKNKKEEIVKDILISKQKAGNNYESKKRAGCFGGVFAY